MESNIQNNKEMTHPLSYFDDILGYERLNLDLIIIKFKNLRHYSSEFDALNYRSKPTEIIGVESSDFSPPGQELFSPEEFRLSTENCIYSELENKASLIFKRIEREAHQKESKTEQKKYLNHILETNIPYYLGA